MTKIEMQTMETLIKELPKIRQAIESLSQEIDKPIIEATPEELLEERCERLREDNINLKLEVIELQKELNNLKNKDNE